MTVTVSAFRQNIFTNFEEVEASRAPLEVTRGDREPMIVVPKGEYESWQETLHQFSSRANAESLLRAIANADAGQLIEVDELDL